MDFLKSRENLLVLSVNKSFLLSRMEHSGFFVILPVLLLELRVTCLATVDASITAWSKSLMILFLQPWALSDLIQSSCMTVLGMELVKSSPDVPIVELVGSVVVWQTVSASVDDWASLAASATTLNPSLAKHAVMGGKGDHTLLRADSIPSW